MRATNDPNSPNIGFSSSKPLPPPPPRKTSHPTGISVNIPPIAKKVTETMSSIERNIQPPPPRVVVSDSKAGTNRIVETKEETAEKKTKITKTIPGTPQKNETTKMTAIANQNQIATSRTLPKESFTPSLQKQLPLSKEVNAPPLPQQQVEQKKPPNVTQEAGKISPTSKENVEKAEDEVSNVLNEICITEDSFLKAAKALKEDVHKQCQAKPTDMFLKEFDEELGKAIVSMKAFQKKQESLRSTSSSDLNSKLNQLEPLFSSPEFETYVSAVINMMKLSGIVSQSNSTYLFGVKESSENGKTKRTRDEEIQPIIFTQRIPRLELLVKTIGGEYNKVLKSDEKIKGSLASAAHLLKKVGSRTNHSVGDVNLGIIGQVISNKPIKDKDSKIDITLKSMEKREGDKTKSDEDLRTLSGTVKELCKPTYRSFITDKKNEKDFLRLTSATFKKCLSDYEKAVHEKQPKSDIQQKKDRLLELTEQMDKEMGEDDLFDKLIKSKTSLTEIMTQARHSLYRSNKENLKHMMADYKECLQSFKQGTTSLEAALEARQKLQNQHKGLTEDLRPSLKERINTSKEFKSMIKESKSMLDGSEELVSFGKLFKGDPATHIDDGLIKKINQNVGYKKFFETILRRDLMGNTAVYSESKSPEYLSLMLSAANNVLGQDIKQYTLENDETKRTILRPKLLTLSDSLHDLCINNKKDEKFTQGLMEHAELARTLKSARHELFKEQKKDLGRKMQELTDRLSKKHSSLNDLVLARSELNSARQEFTDSTSSSCQKRIEASTELKRMLDKSGDLMDKTNVYVRILDFVQSGSSYDLQRLLSDPKDLETIMNSEILGRAFLEKYKTIKLGESTLSVLENQSNPRLKNFLKGAEKLKASDDRPLNL